MTTDLSQIDPRGLIPDAYAIEGISLPECRSIFLDWAMGLPAGIDEGAAAAALLAAYGAGAGAEGHPMSRVLAEAKAGAATPKGRRGGRAAGQARKAAGGGPDA